MLSSSSRWDAFRSLTCISGKSDFASSYLAMQAAAMSRSTVLSGISLDHDHYPFCDASQKEAVRPKREIQIQYLRTQLRSQRRLIGSWSEVLIKQFRQGLKKLLINPTTSLCQLPAELPGLNIISKYQLRVTWRKGLKLEAQNSIAMARSVDWMCKVMNAFTPVRLSFGFQAMGSGNRLKRIFWHFSYDVKWSTAAAIISDPNPSASWGLSISTSHRVWLLIQRPKPFSVGTKQTFCFMLRPVTCLLVPATAINASLSQSAAHLRHPHNST